jgi:uncharacterized membrane protein YkoI
MRARYSIREEFAMRFLGITKLLTMALALGGATRASAQVPKRSAKKEASSERALRAEAKIPEADARRTALAAVPGGKVQSHELERENGKLIYSYDIKVAGRTGIEEVNVDAMTGAIIAHEHEDAKAEAKEKKPKKNP